MTPPFVGGTNVGNETRSSEAAVSKHQFFRQLQPGQVFGSFL